MASEALKTIQACEKQCQQIQGQITGLTKSYWAAVARKKQFEQRLQEVRVVKRSLESAFDGTIDAICLRQRSARGKIETATSGLKHEGELAASISSDTEKVVESDGCGSQMLGNLNQEIARCQREIESARTAANSCVNQISSLESRQDALMRRIDDASNNLEESDGVVLRKCAITRTERLCYV